MGGKNKLFIVLLGGNIIYQPQLILRMKVCLQFFYYRQLQSFLLVVEQKHFSCYTQ